MSIKVDYDVLSNMKPWENERLIKNKIINKNCLDGVKDIEDKSIDMVFCDLPFGETHNPLDKIIPFNELWDAINRVKKDNAAVFLGQLICSNLNGYRYKVTCKKRQPKGWQNANRMPLKAHEDVLVFYDRLPVFNPQKTTGHKRKRATVKNKILTQIIILMLEIIIMTVRKDTH